MGRGLRANLIPSHHNLLLQVIHVHNTVHVGKVLKTRLRTIHQIDSTHFFFRTIGIIRFSIYVVWIGNLTTSSPAAGTWRLDWRKANTSGSIAAATARLRHFTPLSVA